jgi:hypothetical protein
MITTLPDPETTRHIEPQPPTPFQFVWSVLFSNRTKLKLRPEDLEELQNADGQIEPWRKAIHHIDFLRMHPEGAMNDAIDLCVAKPSIENVENIVRRLWVPPYHSMQLNTAASIMEGKIAEKTLELIAPLVRKNLERIHKALQAELSLQLAADAKALARLDGAATGGESAASRTLRQRCQEVELQLAGSNSHLCDWRGVLQPYLP